jgi:hypothetical protein
VPDAREQFGGVGLKSLATEGNPTRQNQVTPVDERNDGGAAADVEQQRRIGLIRVVQGERVGEGEALHVGDPDLTPRAGCQGRAVRDLAAPGHTQQHVKSLGILPAGASLPPVEHLIADTCFACGKWKLIFDFERDVV